MAGFQIDVITIKAPKGHTINLNKVRSALADAKSRMADVIEFEYQKTTATWNEKPNFVKEIKTGEVYVHPDMRTTIGRIYMYTDLGTKPHVIVARNKPRLVFNWPTIPKTRPRHIGSGLGHKGANLAVKKSVRHPGTTPREFSETISKMQGPKFSRLVQNLLREALTGG